MTASTPPAARSPPPRNSVLDNARFLAVLAVICGHCLEPWLPGSSGAGSVYRWLYLFHVPVLVFLAGMTSSTRTGMTAAWKVARGLLGPYLVFQTLYLLFDAFVLGHGPLRLQWHTPFWLLWFLPSLTLWRWGWPWLSRVPGAVALSVAGALAAGWFSALGYVGSFSRTFVFLPFFVAGAAWGPRFPEVSPRFRFIAAFVLLVSMVLFVGPLRTFDTRWLYGSYSYAELGFGPWAGLAMRGAVLAGAAVVGWGFLALVPARSKPWTAMGSRTLQSYLLHGFAVRALPVFAPVWLLGSPGSVGLAGALGLALTLGLSTRRVQRLTAPLWRL
jgi:fucose 4-O-acetylase-like acetyltransferase